MLGNAPTYSNFTVIGGAGAGFKRPDFAALAPSPAGVELEPAAGGFFPPGQSAGVSAMLGLSLGLSVLQRAMNREMRFHPGAANHPAVAVHGGGVVVTAKLTGASVCAPWGTRSRAAKNTSS